MTRPYPPKMDRLLGDPAALALAATYGEASLKEALRDTLAELTAAWRAGGNVPEAEAVLSGASALLASRFEPPLRRVVNATGVVLHTNLGRAPLSGPILAEAQRTLSGYVDLEIDLQTRTRGHRDWRIEESLRSLLGTDRSVVVVNNNAAAVLLLLNTLSAGRECLVSRGELVEIGGGFRMPEVMAASGARLREVGTTNRTRIGDFRKARNAESGLLLKVHTSNYRVLGFTEEVSLSELAALGRELDLPVGYDLGSGLFEPPEGMGLGDEPTVQEALAAGPDVLCFSGDKLFGACQAGILLVAPRLADAFRRNPLLRALRVDKMTYFFLGQALDAYRRGRRDDLPALAMLARSPSRLRAAARALARRIETSFPGRFVTEVVEAEGRAGAGSAPLAPLASPAVSIRSPDAGPEALEAFLRTGGQPPVVGTLSDDRLLLHVRTLLPGDAGRIIDRLRTYSGGSS